MEKNISFTSIWLFSIYAATGATTIPAITLSDYFEFAGKANYDSNIPEKPLLLTPHLVSAVPLDYIQKLAKVPSPIDQPVESYAGFLTINKAFNSNLYFWFFPSERKLKQDPLVLWVQGGPGSSFFGSLFNATGPFRIDGDLRARRSNWSWTTTNNMLYIDSPVGSGFSSTSSDEGYAATSEQAAQQTYAAVVQFFRIFPEYAVNDFYIAGESYGGKIIPQLASIIHRENQLSGKVRIQLKGLFIGCGFMDPVNQIYYANYYYELGVLDKNTRKDFLDIEVTIRKYIAKGNYYRAEMLLVYLLWKASRLGYYPPIDALNTASSYDEAAADLVTKYIVSEDFRKRAKIGSASFHSRFNVMWNLKEDLMNSVSQNISDALKYYRLLLYSGQFDLLIPPAQIERTISALNFRDKEKFLQSEQTVWYVDDEVAGYKKSYGPLTQVMVRRSNHFIVHSQPKWLRDLFNVFTEGERNINMREGVDGVVNEV